MVLLTKTILTLELNIMKKSFKEWEPSDVQSHDISLYTFFSTFFILAASFLVKEMFHGTWNLWLQLLLCVPASIILIILFRKFFLRMFYSFEKD